MPQVAAAVDALPPSAAAALRRLGADLTTARKRRKQSLRAWAARLDVSVPTLMRMERGDPAVSIGVYATALWLIGRQQTLAVAADPKEDTAALESEIIVAARRYRRAGESTGD